MVFDYVIVGGGSGGSTLASRLNEDPETSVCLLEVGGKGDGILVRARCRGGHDVRAAKDQQLGV